MEQAHVSSGHLLAWPGTDLGAHLEHLSLKTHSVLLATEPTQESSVCALEQPSCHLWRGRAGHRTPVLQTEGTER